MRYRRPQRLELPVPQAAAPPFILSNMTFAKRPQAAGLYDPAFEHDACGIGAVACLSGEPTHRTVVRALHVLDSLEHRGASGAEIDTGDGAGILLQTPDAFLRAQVDFELPPRGRRRTPPRGEIRRRGSHRRGPSAR